MSKFTPWKWEYDGPLGVVYSEETYAVIANVQGAGTGSCFCLTPEGQANARLIAAAPEMYDALCELVCLDGCTSCMCESRAQAVKDARDLLARIDGAQTNDA